MGKRISGINLKTVTALMVIANMTGLSACGSGANAEKTDSEAEIMQSGDENSGGEPETAPDNEAGEADSDAEDADEKVPTADETADFDDKVPAADETTDFDEPEILTFVDAFGESYQTEIDPEVEKNTYDKSLFIHDGDLLKYDDSEYDYRLGVDVSHHNGQIDWDKVADAGYEFTILRLGYRGYGQTGTLNLDKEFDNNIINAQEAGLDVGVYFFAQAVSEEEAIEEAQFVIDHLDGYELQLPVVYDPESILDDVARTDDVTGEQFTKNTIAFCRAIEDAGYDAMIYSNMKWEAYEFDLTELADWPIWYADYESQPQTPYRFTFWQYSNTGKVAGIYGDADLDIQLIGR